MPGQRMQLQQRLSALAFTMLGRISDSTHFLRIFVLVFGVVRDLLTRDHTVVHSYASSESSYIIGKLDLFFDMSKNAQRLLEQL